MVAAVIFIALCTYVSIIVLIWIINACSCKIPIKFNTGHDFKPRSPEFVRRSRDLYLEMLLISVEAFQLMSVGVKSDGVPNPYLVQIITYMKLSVLQLSKIEQIYAFLPYLLIAMLVWVIGVVNLFSTSRGSGFAIFCCKCCDNGACRTYGKISGTISKVGLYFYIPLIYMVFTLFNCDKNNRGVIYPDMVCFEITHTRLSICAYTMLVVYTVLAFLWRLQEATAKTDTSVAYHKWYVLTKLTGNTAVAMFNAFVTEKITSIVVNLSILLILVSSVIISYIRCCNRTREGEAEEGCGWRIGGASEEKKLDIWIAGCYGIVISTYIVNIISYGDDPGLVLLIAGIFYSVVILSILKAWLNVRYETKINPAFQGSVVKQNDMVVPV